MTIPITCWNVTFSLLIPKSPFESTMKAKSNWEIKSITIANDIPKRRIAVISPNTMTTPNVPPRTYKKGTSPKPFTLPSRTNIYIIIATINPTRCTIEIVCQGLSSSLILELKTPCNEINAPAIIEKIIPFNVIPLSETLELIKIQKTVYEKGHMSDFFHKWLIMQKCHTFKKFD